MTKQMPLLFLSFFLLIFLPYHIVAQSLQFEDQLIENIDIVIHTNAGAVSDTDNILNRLRTKKGGVFSQANFDEDLKTLAQDYDRVDPSVNCDGEDLNITLDVWPKPSIRTIHWHGNQHIKTSALQKELGISCFSVFERHAFNLAFHKLKAYYISHGYFEAQLDYQTQVDLETNEVTITIDITEGRSGKIQEIQFINFTDDEQKHILHDMVTKKYNLFTSWYTQTGIYNEDAIQQDRLVITNDLQNNGYADASVEINVTESCKTNRIIVTIIANKGPLYTFGELTFEGNCVIENGTIDELFEVRPGDPYSLEGIRETIEVITDAYGRLGHIDAVIDFEPELIEGEYQYNVRFKIVEGEQFRVGLIRVFGNTSTKTPVILHETLMIPGEIFNTLKLKATERRLTNIGYFKHVNVYIVKGTESSLLEGNYRDVYIEVEETNTGQFSIFLGYSSVEELFAGINVTERNFNHEGIYYMWRDGLRALRGGGEYLQLSAQIGQKSRTYTLSWTKPYFLDTKWSIGVDLSDSTTRYISKEYDLETISLALRANYDINPFLRWGLQYRLKNGSVDLHHHASHINDLEREADIQGLISAVGTSLSYDSTNHPIKPSEGFRSKLFLEYAGLGGDHHFFNIGYMNSYYFPVGSRLVIKYRADFRFIQPIGETRYETIPLDERIFLGGDFMVRGFRPYRLGPHYPHHDDVPRGGLSMQFYSVEMVRRIIQDWELFAFIDAGYLGQKTWEFGRMSASIGYGMRFKVIDSIPPVTIGMGYPLNAHSRSDVKKFFFSFGGNF
ncbi:MAG: outer membrane protein assembly factor BamA [Parachlamydiaceae bacterium]